MTSGSDALLEPATGEAPSSTSSSSSLLAVATSTTIRRVLSRNVGSEVVWLGFTLKRKSHWLAPKPQSMAKIWRPA